jgi:beta-aspartyl-peptidase (threonine type)
MRIYFLLILLSLCTTSNRAQSQRLSPTLVIHGGAGAMSRTAMSREAEAAYRAGLERALRAGYSVLDSGGSALDAVTIAVTMLEDDSLFNAGRGAVLTRAGTFELDAAIMDGRSQAAGSVAGIKTVKNPVLAARAVMEKSPHVMLAGPGADSFAKDIGLVTVPHAYFFTQKSFQSLEHYRRDEAERRRKADSAKGSGALPPLNPDQKWGTVGAVALDRAGHLAAATSTGGMTGKRLGRIGDAPVIGAGTYANDATCAISCTGWGEYFIRLSMAKSVSDRMELAGQPLQAAGDTMIYKRLPQLGGDGGLIAVDKAGNITMPFNTAGMFRGWMRKGESPQVRIWKDE